MQGQRATQWPFWWGSCLASRLLAVAVVDCPPTTETRPGTSPSRTCDMHSRKHAGRTSYRMSVCPSSEGLLAERASPLRKVAFEIRPPQDSSLGRRRPQARHEHRLARAQTELVSTPWRRSSTQACREHRHLTTLPRVRSSACDLATVQPAVMAPPPCAPQATGHPFVTAAS
jgi:hypothetical protein